MVFGNMHVAYVKDLFLFSQHLVYAKRPVSFKNFSIPLNTLFFLVPMTLDITTDDMS